VARQTALVDPELGPLTDDLLARDVRVFQRSKGHRFSSDDVVTAYVAFGAQPQARRVLDLGCGLGSVLLLLAWKLPSANLCGVEAQAQSFALLERNVARSRGALGLRRAAATDSW
jgi:tRNA1Val (adenine37-N6)-methyltransferase